MAISVCDAVVMAATLISRGDLAQRAEARLEYDTEVALLVRCFNLTESEIALGAFPITVSEEHTPADGCIAFSDLDREPIQIVSVRDLSDMGVPFSVVGQKIVLKGEVLSVKVAYTCAPTVKTIADTCELTRVTTRLLALGVASHFLLAQGRYAEAAAFEARYQSAVRAANVVRHKLVLRARRWA